MFITINSRNYVVSEGYYTIGVHVFTNALDYLSALYIGRRDVLNYVVILAGVATLLVRGNPRVRFATSWMLLALAPFLSFNWGNTSRYLYQPAIGFSLLLAEAVIMLDRAAGRRVGSRARFREIHGTVPANSTVVAEPPTRLPYQFINAAVQWDYRDPTIRLVPYDSGDVP